MIPWIIIGVIANVALCWAFYTFGYKAGDEDAKQAFRNDKYNIEDRSYARGYSEGKADTFARVNTAMKALTNPGAGVRITGQPQSSSATLTKASSGFCARTAASARKPNRANGRSVLPTTVSLGSGRQTCTR